MKLSRGKISKIKKTRSQSQKRRNKSKSSDHANGLNKTFRNKKGKKDLRKTSLKSRHTSEKDGGNPSPFARPGGAPQPMNQAVVDSLATGQMLPPGGLPGTPPGGPPSDPQGGPPVMMNRQVPPPPPGAPPGHHRHHHHHKHGEHHHHHKHGEHHKHHHHKHKTRKDKDGNPLPPLMPGQHYIKHKHGTPEEYYTIEMYVPGNALKDEQGNELPPVQEDEHYIRHEEGHHSIEKHSDAEKSSEETADPEELEKILAPIDSKDPDNNEDANKEEQDKLDAEAAEAAAKKEEEDRLAAEEAEAAAKKEEEDRLAAEAAEAEKKKEEDEADLKEQQNNESDSDSDSDDNESTLEDVNVNASSSSASGYDTETDLTVVEKVTIGDIAELIAMKINGVSTASIQDPHRTNVGVANALDSAGKKVNDALTKKKGKKGSKSDDSDSDEDGDEKGSSFLSVFKNNRAERKKKEKDPPKPEFKAPETTHLNVGKPGRTDEEIMTANAEVVEGETEETGNADTTAEKRGALTPDDAANIQENVNESDQEKPETEDDTNVSKNPAEKVGGSNKKTRSNREKKKSKRTRKLEAKIKNLENELARRKSISFFG